MTGWRWAVAVVALVLLLAGVVLTQWDRPATVVAQAPAPMAPRTEARTIDADARAIDQHPVPAADEGAPAEVRRATLVRPTAARPRAQKPKARPAPRKSFFKRELFRIVFK